MTDELANYVCRPQIDPDLAEDLIELLSEAAVEIRNHAGRGNIVVARLRAMERRLEGMHQPPAHGEQS